jgi:hypothetical protein
VTDLRAVLDAHLSGWRAQAECRDEPDEDLFLSDKNLPRMPGSPTVVLALMLCARCPVRRPCLVEALRPTHLAVERYSDSGEQQWVLLGGIQVAGIWGGTTESERTAATHIGLTTTEIVDALEATFDERLERRLGAALIEPEVGRVHHRRARLRAMAEVG